MSEKKYVPPEGTTPLQIIALMEGTPYAKRMQALYDHYSGMGLLEGQGAEAQFINEAWIRFHALDLNYYKLMVMSKNAKHPVKREIQKLVRMKGDDGKEYIRFSARFSTINKIGEELSTTVSPCGYWEEPVFRKVYDAKEMEWGDSTELEKTVPHYDIPWTPEKVKELSKDFVQEPYFTIEDNSSGSKKKYRIDRDSWCTKQRPEIVEEEKRKEKQQADHTAVDDLVKALKSAK